MTKPRLLPLHLEDHPTESFHVQRAHLRKLTGELVDWLDPSHIDDPISDDASAVVVPDLSGRAYRMVDSVRRVDRPDPGDHLRVRHRVHVGLGDP